MEYLVLVALLVGGVIGILDAVIQKHKKKKSGKQKNDSLDEQEKIMENKEMRLLEFVEKYDSEEQIRILNGEEVIYEGEVGNLCNILQSYVYEKSAKVVDGITQIKTY